MKGRGLKDKIKFLIHANSIQLERFPAKGKSHALSCSVLLDTYDGGRGKWWRQVRGVLFDKNENCWKMGLQFSQTAWFRCWLWISCALSLWKQLKVPFRNLKIWQNSVELSVLSWKYEMCAVELIWICRENYNMFVF